MVWQVITAISAILVLLLVSVVACFWDMWIPRASSGSEEGSDPNDQEHGSDRHSSSSSSRHSSEIMTWKRKCRDRFNRASMLLETSQAALVARVVSLSGDFRKRFSRE